MPVPVKEAEEKAKLHAEARRRTEKALIGFLQANRDMAYALDELVDQFGIESGCVVRGSPKVIKFMTEYGVLYAYGG